MGVNVIKKYQNLVISKSSSVWGAGLRKKIKFVQKNWMITWADYKNYGPRWMEVTAVLRVAYSNQK